MRILKIELLILLLIGIIAIAGRLSLNFGRFDFTYNVITLINPDWKGAPYIIKELNVQNRHFDDAAVYFGNHQSSDLHQILESYPDYMTAYTSDKGMLYTDGTEYEVCLGIIDKKITPLKRQLFSKQFDLQYLCDITYQNISYPNRLTEHHTIEFKSKLNIEGLVSDRYVDQQIEEFLLHSTFQLMNEYLQPEKLRAYRFQMHIINSYLWGSMLAMGHI